MLIFDKGGTPNWNLLKTRLSSGASCEGYDIEDAKYTPIQTYLQTLEVSLLRDLIKKDGSCIVNLPGHAIVVDEVSEDLSNVRLRDPCHGWEITVKAAAFTNVWNPPYFSRDTHYVYQIGLPILRNA